MFDIGFWELIIIMIVALLVIGPERLPGIARKAGMWVGKGRRFVSSIKQDIDRELAAEDLRRVLREQQESSGVHEIIEETRETIDETKSALNQTRGKLGELEKDLEESESDYVLKATPDESKALPGRDEPSEPAPGGVEDSSPSDDEKKQQ